MRLGLFYAVAFVMAAGCCPARASEETALTPEDAAQLQRDKVLITEREFRQVFSAYVNHPTKPVPVFLTSDSLLAAWNVLFEASLAQMEDRHALVLSGSLRAVHGWLETKAHPPEGMEPEAWGRGVRRVQIVLGTAARLNGGRWSAAEDVERAIVEQVALVEAADGVHLPDWLPPDPEMAGLDYAVFRPTGLYAGNVVMEGYFRATRWLQAIPFRAGNEEEMAAVKIVVEALDDDAGWRSLAEDCRGFGGRPADRDVFDMIENGVGAVEEWRERQKSATARMVILSAMRLPDAAVFDQSTGAARPFPEGVEIAAWLGSPLARRRLEAAAVPTADMRDADAYRISDTVYDSCLDSLQALFAPPEPDAPDFMKSEAWQRKSLNTGLAGWSLLRHSWALQGKSDANWLGSGNPYPGFVEPCPEFFRRMSVMIGMCQMQFENAGALTPSPEVMAARAAELLTELEPVLKEMKARIDAFVATLPAGSKLTAEQDKEARLLLKLPEKWKRLLEPFSGVLSCVKHSTTGDAMPDELLVEMRKLSAGEKSAEILWPERSRTPLRGRWALLLSTCHRMESLAHKQLRGVDLTEDDARFIR